MLARDNRVNRPDDFRVTVRRGRRGGGPHLITYCLQTGDPGVRFGFLVSKAVGPAVMRNRVRRRLRAAARELLVDLREGSMVVVRALPGSDAVPFAELSRELEAGLRKADAVTRTRAAQ